MNPYSIPGLKSKEFAIPEETKFKKIIFQVLESSEKTEKEWAIRNNTNATWKSIGDYFYRHHSTVIHAHNTITRLIEIKDESVLNIMERIKVFL